MPQYLDDSGNPIKDPVKDAKKFLADTGPSYLDENTGEPVVNNPEVPKSKTTLDRLMEFGDKSAFKYLPEKYQPANIVSKFTEPLKQYGESGTDLLHKAALYGGAYADELANVAESLASPTNMALTAATMGSGAAGKLGLSSVARALEIPGQVAGGLMIGHGGAKALNSEGDTSDRIAGVAEAVLGGMGLKGHASGEIKSSELLTEVPKTSKFGIPFGTEEARLNEIAAKEKAGTITADDLKEAQTLTRKLKSLGKTRELVKSVAKANDEVPIANNEPAADVPLDTPPVESQPTSQFTKPKVRPAYDDTGRLVGYETIKAERPSQFDVNKSIETGKPEYLNNEGIVEPTIAKPKTEFDQLMSDYNNSLGKDEVPSFKGFQEFRASRESTSIPATEQAPQYLDENTGEPVAAAENKPTATYNAYQPDETHPQGGFHLYDVKGGPLDRSTVSAETLGNHGIEIPPTPEAVSNIPAPIKAILDANNIDSTGMDTTTAVNKARELKGMESTTSTNTAPAEIPQDPINRLKDAMKQSSDARASQETINANERSVRAGKISSVTTPGVAGLKEKAALLKGEYPKIPIESQLTQQDLDGLVNHLNTSELMPYQKLNAGMAITKLGEGKAITPYEAKLLGKVFGNDFEELIHLNAGLPIKNLFSESVNLPKTMMATLDLSAPLRQGLPLITTKEYWNSFTHMLRSEKSFNDFQSGLIERPNYEIGHEGGLYLADTGHIAHREEQFLSHLVDKIPLLGAAKKASERAYTGFLNKLRADTFDNLLKDMENSGIEIRNSNGGPTKAVRDLASFVNNATGRGSLGGLEKNAVELNALLFSPRLISSRLTMLNPVYYAKLDPFVRKQALKALFSVAGAGMLTSSLLKKAGATVSTDPYNTDFGKAKIGNTRLDPFGGFQQPIVAATRLIGGRQNSVNGASYDLNHSKFPNPTRLSVVGNFARSKESPIAKFVDDLLLGDQAFKPGGLGSKFGSGDNSARVINMVTPMLINDMIDLKKENPDLIPGVSLAALATFGDSLQTMQPAKPKSAFRINNLSVGAP